jgi:hypothetical protein
MAEPLTALVDEDGRFHCPCGATHGRGPVDSGVYRCLACGRAYRVRGVTELRPAASVPLTPNRTEEP